MKICDVDLDWYLNIDELTVCIMTVTLPKAKDYEFAAFINVLDPEKHPEAPTFIPLMLDYLDPTKTGFINFSQYVYLRRVHLAWKKCALDDSLTLKNVSCATYVIAPSKPIYLPDAGQLF